MAKWQRVRIDIPKGLRPTERLAVASEIIDFIIDRTKSGKDKDNKPFPKYSKGYKDSKSYEIAGKSGNVDITLSGETLNSLELISHTNGSILIGYDKGDSELNGKVEGNRIGSYGQKEGDSKKARDFLGITEGDKKKITNKYPVKTKKERESTRRKAIDIVTALSESREAVE